MDRREFVLVAGSAALAAALPAPPGDRSMYGLIGKLRAAPGKREQLLELILQATGAMPGCLSYVVARDPADTSALWVTEVWTDAESHKASLELPHVQETIARARPLVTGFEFQIETEPAGGVGLT